MGHREKTDLGALGAIAINAWQVAQLHILPGEGGELLRELPDLTVAAAAFEVRFQLQDDVWGGGDSQSRTLCALRFRPTGDVCAVLPPERPTNPGATRIHDDFPWTLLMRGDWPERADRLPAAGRLGVRRLRKAVGAERDERVRRPVFNLDSLYVMRNTPPEDVTAQIVLFAYQTGLARGADSFGWLARYIKAHFRVWPAEVATSVVAHLIQHKSLADDARAWRKYVSRIVRKFSREYAFLTGGPLEPGSHVGQERERTPSDRAAGFLTIEEAARRIGVARSTLYNHVDRGKVTIARLPGAMRLTVSEVESLARTTRLPDVIERVALRRGTSGNTARRFVSRQRRKGLSLERILELWGEPARTSLVG
jgi:excisionase family DNA binding protein